MRKITTERYRKQEKEKGVKINCKKEEGRE